MATKVFISWSGSLSRQVAELLKSWIGDVLHGVEPWISTEDIEKGSIWFGQLNDQLAQIAVGLICLTRDNMTAPWILFEAGALSKGLTQNRVCPILIDLEPLELQAPLAQFNLTKPEKNDMLRLIKMINAQCTQPGSVVLTEEKLVKSFEKWWDDFDGSFKKILESRGSHEEPKRRSIQDTLDEILGIVRAMQRRTQAGSPHDQLVFDDAVWANLIKSIDPHATLLVPAAGFPSRLELANPQISPPLPHPGPPGSAAD